MPNYKRPPLIDAVIEVRFSKELAPTELEAIAKKLKKDYPFEKNNVQIEMMAAVSDRGEVLQTARASNGRVLESTDNQSIVTVMPQYVSSGVRAPYPGWDVLFASFVNIWKVTKDVAGFKTAARIGSRFINRIDIPIQDNIQEINIADYLKVGIQSPADHSIKNYDISLVVKLEDDFSATIRTATTEPAIPLTAALLLDVDIYSTDNIPARDDELLKKIKLIQGKKNTLFESFITDKSREIFNTEVT